jgi:hypothetical protein
MKEPILALMTAAKSCSGPTSLDSVISAGTNGGRPDLRDFLYSQRKQITQVGLSLCSPLFYPQFRCGVPSCPELIQQRVSASGCTTSAAAHAPDLERTPSCPVLGRIISGKQASFPHVALSPSLVHRARQT